MFTYLETASDMFKLFYVTKRPLSMRTNNIKSWEVVMEFMSYLAIVTNLMLFSFSSDQIAIFFPEYFHSTFDMITNPRGKKVPAPSPREGLVMVEATMIETEER